MGGIGSGGRRLGAGRKSKDSALALVHGSRERGTRPVVPDGAVAGPVPAVEKPLDLPEADSALWDQLAPHALANGSLTPGTAWAFRQLCKVAVLEQKIADDIDAEGLTNVALDTKMDADGGGSQLIEKKANPLLARHTALLLRVEAGLARFRLAPDGKDHGPVVAPKELSALEKLQAQAKSMRRVK